MSSLFYPKLAITNIKKNSKFYFPYMLTCIATVAMFYIMNMIGTNEGINSMPGGDALKMIMTLGIIVIGLFSVIFLFYTNSFLIKRRKKELGLYNILGMEKRHVAKILLLETVFTSVGTIFIGLFIGILLSKLFFLVLFKILRFSVALEFYVSMSSILMTIALFAGIFLATLGWNLVQIKLAKPIDLLKSGNTGEKEPKVKLLLVIIGLLSIAAGYYIAIVTESPLEALMFFFVAVVLVIIGTYCLFTAGSIAILKLLKKNKNYYYSTNNFISVSTMMYRMKQNAVGLANICILSTMVLVMVSTTVSLYIGAEAEIEKRYPKDISIDFYSLEKENINTIQKAIEDIVEKNEITMDNRLTYEHLQLAANIENNTFVVSESRSINNSDTSSLLFLTMDEYAKITGEHVNLEKNQVLMYIEGSSKIKDSFMLFDKEYIVVDRLEEIMIPKENAAYISNSEYYYFIVRDEEVLNDIYEGQRTAMGKYINPLEYYMGFDISEDSSEKSIIVDEIKQGIQDNITIINNDENWPTGFYLQDKQMIADEFYSLYGGFLFLGIFLGILFLMATALIIYYKQISEGYDDKHRFEIMKKVGLSKAEVKKSINSQIKKVFFLPLLAAIIHIIAAFKMITRLLILFSLTNTTLFIMCTIGTILVFTGIYGLVYALTAKAYYNIVR